MQLWRRWLLCTSNLETCRKNEPFGLLAYGHLSCGGGVAEFDFQLCHKLLYIMYGGLWEIWKNVLGL